MTIVNLVLNGLESCRKLGSDSFINCITVEIYNKITKTLSGEVLASKIIPNVVMYLIDPTIETEDEFSMYKNAVNNMIAKIEEERKKMFKSGS
jgi:hypothetical protein